MEKSKKPIIQLVLILILILIASCGKTPDPTLAITSPSVELSSTLPPTAIKTALSPTQKPTVMPVTILTALPPEPQVISFTTTDGTALQGLYYPAAVNPAPLVVLMHWANSNMSDWYEVAVWLQNRGQVNPFPNPGKYPWWDPSWFPKIPADKTYAVFIFTFRGCKSMESGCSSFNTTGWLNDAQSAMLKAQELDGIDPNRIVSIGSSIGADGAADGCLFLNDQTPGACKGALSLSPNSYLTLKYSKVVEKMGSTDPQPLVWCLADQNEIKACKDAELPGNTNYQVFEIKNGQHGTMMLRPKLEPLPMNMILEFLTTTLK